MLYLEVWCRGHFVANPEMHYDGGEIVYLNDIDPDYMSRLET